MPFTDDERQEFAAVVFPLLDEMHALALHLCRSQSTAEDLVAETVVRACANFRELRDRSKAKPWLFRILTNAFLSSCRKQKTRQEVSYEEVEGEDDTGSFSLFQQLSQPFLLWWGNPEREFINKLMDEDIRRALDALSEDHRVVILLSDVEGLSYAEISDALDIPVGTVRSRLARARGVLQQKLWRCAQEMGFGVTRRRSRQEALKE